MIGLYYIAKILEIFYNLDPSIMINMSQDNNINNISIEESKMRKPYKLDDIYIETNLSTKDICNMIKMIIETYKLEETDLGILLRR